MVQDWFATMPGWLFFYAVPGIIFMVMSLLGSISDWREDPRGRC